MNEESLTKKEIFNKVKNHLLKQNERSLRDNDMDCAYRSPDGKTCAVGCLLLTYDSRIESCSILVLIAEDWEEEKEGDYLKLKELLVEAGVFNHLGLLQDLQALHDYSAPEIWDRKLDELEVTL